MDSRTIGLLGGLTALILVIPLRAGEPARAGLRGEVVEVGPAAKDPKHPAARPDRLALQTADGKLHPLVKDPGSRALFDDARLRHTPVQLTVVRRPGKSDLQVVAIQRVKGGKLYDVDYWCDVCSIAMPWPQKCPCCQAEMALRERPAKDARPVQP